MEETLPIEHTSSETDDESGGSVMAAVGCLKVLAKDGEKERCYPVFKGVNTVGRSTSCQICIPIKAISKHHATILVEKDSHFLQDNNSKNHTRRNKVLLRPQTYYELSNKCDLLFGDCACIYYTSKERWEAFVAKRDDDDDSQTLCETVAVAATEDPLPASRAGNDPCVVAKGSRDVTDALFSPDEVTDKPTLPGMTEQTQLLFTANADGPTVTNGSDSVGSSPLLAEQDHEATQLIPLAEISAAEHNETEGNEEPPVEPTIAYPIAPTTNSPGHSPMMEDDDIEATIPYDMTQGVNLLTKGTRSASNSPVSDIENTIPYEMTQGIMGDNLNESPTSKRSPVNDIDPTIPYEMSDASPPGCDPGVGVAEHTEGMTEHTEGVAEHTEGVAEHAEDVANTTVGVADPTAVDVDEPTVRMDEPTVPVAEPTAIMAESTVGVAEPAVDLDETQSIGDNDPTMAVTDATVGVVDAMDDDDATQTVDCNPTVGVAEMDTGDTDVADQHMETQDDNHAEQSNNTVHVSPAVSPTHSPARASPSHKTTPILKNATSPRSPASKKVHFESGKPSTLHLSTPPPTGSRATVSLDDEESPDIELPSAKTLLEPHPPLCSDDNATTTTTTTTTATSATASTGRGGARRKGKGKSETAASTKTRNIPSEKNKTASNKKEAAENKRGGARNRSAASSKTEDATSSRTRSSGTENAKDKKKNSRNTGSTAKASTSAAAKGKAAAKKGKAQAPSKRGGKRKAADPSTDSDETPSVTPITTPINESPSFLTDADALFSGGGRIKRKYTDFLSTPKRDHLLRREESLSIESTSTKSPMSSNNLLLTSQDLHTSQDQSTKSHNLSAASHDPSDKSHDVTKETHDPVTVSHNQATVSHDPAKTSHDPANTSHDPPAASQDTLPKVLFTGIVDEDAQKVVKELGGELVESVFDCTHLVTDDKLRRTLKLLCCIGRGCPIVGTQWLKKCKQQKKFISAEPFIIKDRTFEKQRKCSLSASLTKARAGPPLLHNQQFFITHNVQPVPSEMVNIIKCSGGEVLDRMPLVGSDTVSIITCDADLSTCKAASEGGVSLYTSEYLLSGILRQKLDPESHCLVVKDEERSGKNKRRISSSSSSESSTKRRRK